MDTSTTKQTALLIIDLSSLDSYTDLNGASAGEELSFVLLDAMLLHAGPVFLTDQEWEGAGRLSRPRRTLEEGLKARPDIVRVHFDEASQDWEEGMQELGGLLRDQRVDHVVLGGLWATLNGSSGGVNEAMRLLEQQGFACRIDFSLCGLEEEETERASSFPDPAGHTSSPGGA